MSRIRCKGCNEYPAFTAVSCDREGNHIRGEKCNLCGAIRIIQTRSAPKRDARKAWFEATLQQILAS
jgi:formate dehydrogenase maturation protein FdhE